MLLAGSFTILSLALSAVCTCPPTSPATAGVITNCVVPNTVALTFDDGPYDFLHKLVDTLKSAGGTGTFFFNGDNWRQILYPEGKDRVKYAFDHGFQIGSHTWAHKHLPELTEDQIYCEMACVEDAVYNITGSCPAFTRPPYGEYDDVVLKVAAERLQQLVNWDFDSGDASFPATPVEDQKRRYDEVVTRHPDTILSLQHEVKQTTVYEVLPYAIKKLQDAGYKLVTLADCLGQKPYLKGACKPLGGCTCTTRTQGEDYGQPPTQVILEDL